MKILSDIESTLKYLKELRKSTYSNILTSGNGFFEKDYSVEEYVKKIMDLTKLNGDDFLFELSSKLDDEKLLFFLSLSFKLLGLLYLDELLKNLLSFFLHIYHNPP